MGGGEEEIDQKGGLAGLRELGGRAEGETSRLGYMNGVDLVP